MRAAPVSWLPAPGDVVATALSRVAGESPEITEMRSCRETFVDLPAFVSDDEAALVEVRAAGPPGGPRRVDRHAGSDSRPDQVSAAVLDWIRHAQALAISFLREDDRVQGALNALNGSYFAIGQARLTLEAVDSYKDAQTLGLASIVTWPIGLAGGLAAGSLMERPTIAAIGAALVRAAAGWLLAPAPAWGCALRSLHSRLRRRAMRLDRTALVVILVNVVEGLMFAIWLGGPVVLGFLVALPALGSDWSEVRQGPRSGARRPCIDAPLSPHTDRWRHPRRSVSHACAVWLVMRRTRPVSAGIGCMDASSGSAAEGERATGPDPLHACMHLRVTPGRRPPGRADPGPSPRQGSAVWSGGR